MSASTSIYRLPVISVCVCNQSRSDGPPRGLNAVADSLETAVGIVAGALPGVDALYDAANLISKTDVLTGEDITWVDKLLVVIGFLIPIASGKLLRLLAGLLGWL